MKIRSNYVSNSSSSSFIVQEDLTKEGIACLLLNQEQVKLLTGCKMFEDDEVSFQPQSGKNYYLTEYISDCDDRWDMVKKSGYCFQYSSGGHGGPYEESAFNEYTVDDSSVWLLKEHDEAKQMSFNKFAKRFREEYGNLDVIVKYDGEGINLRLVR